MRFPSLKRIRTYGSQIAFIDLLFNTLVGFVFLFVLAFILINPVAKKSNVEVIAEFIITTTWPDNSADDIDTWVKDPVGNIVGFKQKDRGLMNLDRDDLGRANDTIEMLNGEKILVRQNIEHVTIRGIIPGEYIVNVHLYRRSPRHEVLEEDYFENIPVRVNVEKLNPYGVVYIKELLLTVKGEEKTVLRFTVDADGKITEINDLPYQIVKSISSYEGER
tara:strand:+ start:14374 stop:15033 length:660 start_codon:yes stop_codon:yes gene_type:complete